MTDPVNPCPHVCVRCAGCPDCCPCTMADLLAAEGFGFGLPGYDHSPVIPGKAGDTFRQEGNQS